MALGRTLTAALEGVQATLVTVEANIGPGLPGINVVGLGDAAVAESKDRIRTAVANSKLDWPKTKIVVSMSPADMRKSGSHFDLPTAIAVLAAGTIVDRDLLDTTLIVGELGLDASVRPVAGVLPMLLAAKREGLKHALVPPGNAAEARLIDDLQVTVVHTLAEAWEWVLGMPFAGVAATELAALLGDASSAAKVPDFADVVGQPQAKWAAEVAAAGGHHMFMVGPPGTGKSMIARRLPSILPPLSLDEQLETSAIHSVTGTAQSSGALEKAAPAPFVAPHHSVTRAALIGGGSGTPKPGAVSLAHHGVLFLDEASEISAGVLDGLRTPLEDGEVRLVRSRRDVCFPARFQLVMASNPCLCAAEDPAVCRCTSAQRAKYLNNLSGPLRDRIDIIVRTTATAAVVDEAAEAAEASTSIRERVIEARARSRHRWGGLGIDERSGTTNAAMDPHLVRRNFPADEAAMALLGAYLADGVVSRRGVDRALKLAWTLADLDGAGIPDLDHMARAITLRTDELLNPATPGVSAA